MIGSRRLVQLGACLSSLHYNFYQTAMASLLVPPLSVRGKNDELDKDAFSITLDKVPSLALPTKSLNECRGKLKDFLLKLPKFKPIQPCPDAKDNSIVYLDPRKVGDITDAVKKEVQWTKYFQESKVELTYENWPCDEVLKAVLPDNIEVPTSYSLIGHIVHLNLREEQLPYKTVIGQVFLDKIPTARTVVNKLDAIDNTYRNFAMEILVGEDTTIVLVKENGLMYNFDFAKVYWNPRLCTEHAALVKLLEPGDVLYDVFAGVGPFVIPAAKKGVKVMCNDLNPESCKWLCQNARTNKVTASINAFNKDGRDFLREDVKKDLLERRHNDAEGNEHLTMNLPAMAVEFLDVFADWMTRDEARLTCLRPPIVHLYCFIRAAKCDDFDATTKQLVEEHLGTSLTDKSLIKIHHVRNVAPNKEMMRVSFRLTRDLLMRPPPSSMGKNKAKAKNVFKVAGARSQKAKTKAKKVKTTLKKLDLGQGSKLNREKTVAINKQLVELSKEVRQQGGKKMKKAKHPAVGKVASVSAAAKDKATELVKNMQL